MLILGIETSSSQVSCALGHEEGLLAAFAADRGPRHAEVLVPAIATVLEAGGVTIEDVDALAVSQGPGLFTGLRVGIATAEALALSRRIPLQGVPTLDVVAQAGRLADRPVVAVTDARRGEVFHARYRPRPPGRPERSSGDRVTSPAALAEELGAGGPVLLVGSGVDRHADLFERWASASPPGSVLLVGGSAGRPGAATVVELARPALQAAAAGGRPAGPLSPIYLRAPDAEARWVERGGVVGAFEPAAGERGVTAGDAARRADRAGGEAA